MKKPADLRAHLTATVPIFATNPDSLQMFIERGGVATKRGAGLSFVYHYTLQILVTDYTDPVDTLTIPLLVWIATHQPDLFDNTDKRDKAIGIEAEAISHTATDIVLSLDLSERVIVTATEAGWICSHVDEPPLPDLGGPTNWQILHHEEVLYPPQQPVP